MDLSPESSWGNHQVPYILGSYEEELHEVVEEIIARSPAVVVDIGAAEGYYAIGFARRLPKTTVFAIDLDSRARQVCEENVQLTAWPPMYACVMRLGPGILTRS